MRAPVTDLLRIALGAAAHHVDALGATLEVSLGAQESGRTRSSPLVTDAGMQAHSVGPPSPPGFGAFVDGVQESRVAAFAGVVPVVRARMGAVIRARVDRRLVTWGDGPLLDDALYFPFERLGEEVVRVLTDGGCTAIDTSDDAIRGEDVHPQHLLRRAVHLVQRRREALEGTLAERWCDASLRSAGGDGAPMLYVDGGLPAAAPVLDAGRAVGVVKSHHTLYATGRDLERVLALAPRERSSLFRVETRWRAPVGSWYLRVRAAAGREPLWGVVRLEASFATLGEEAGADARADEISRWVLAEATPLALPDARWDTMAYGIRDCEVFLRATLGARPR